MADLQSYDRHLGRQIRLRRRLLGLTQADLGQELAITAQQIQKYEKGENRISASMLLAIGQALDAPVSSFYHDLEPQANEGSDVERITPPEPSHVARLLDGLPDGAAKSAIEHLIIALAANEVALVPSGETPQTHSMNQLSRG